MDDSTPTPGTGRYRLGLVGLAAAGLLAGGALGLSGMASAATPTPSPAPSTGTADPADDPLCDKGAGGRDRAPSTVPESSTSGSAVTPEV